jgi:hypothetical protein
MQATRVKEMQATRVKHEQATPLGAEVNHF